MNLNTLISDPLADIIDAIFSKCSDDAACIAAEIRSLDPEIRDAVLTSDLLNAWQVFFFYFADYPGDEAVEFLVFHSAGELPQGVPMGEAGILSLTFSVSNGRPAISISDDIREIARFSGSSAWKESVRFLEEQ